MTTKKKATPKPPREDFNEAAYRIVNSVVRKGSAVSRPVERKSKTPR